MVKPEAIKDEWRRALRATGLRAISVPVVYAAFGVVWILASDLFLESLRLDPVLNTRIAMAKGWIFVAGSTFLLSVVLRGAWNALGRASDDLQRELERRRRAQEESARLAVELEKRVQERTVHLEAALRELGMFTDSVSHDVRAPVRSIHGFARILLEDHAAEFSPEAARLLERVTDSAARMDRMIEGLMDLSRSRRDALRIRELSAVEHETLVDTVWAEVEAGHPERVFRYRREALGGVHADIRLLETLWRNLLGNAAKYTRNRAEAVIEVERDGDWFVVRDNGVGFSNAHVFEIFRPFRRLHRSEEFEGDGIGLALVRSILDRHDGVVEASGEPGVGATIRFRIPASLAEAEAPDGKVVAVAGSFV